MELRVSATRMELMKLKRRLELAKRGYKLLKDKLDGLIQDFIKTSKELRVLYDELRDELVRAFAYGTISSAGIDSQAYQAALLLPTMKTEVHSRLVNMMGVKVPKLEAKTSGELKCFGGIYFTEYFTKSLEDFNELMPKMIKLAELFKTLQRVGQAIIEIKRRVNALEYILIPELETATRYIKMRLAEMERETTVSLLKIKEMVIQKR